MFAAEIRMKRIRQRKFSPWRWHLDQSSFGSAVSKFRYTTGLKEMLVDRCEWHCMLNTGDFVEQKHRSKDDFRDGPP